MKLRNKKSGEIAEFITGNTFEMGGIQILSLGRNPQVVLRYDSLAELNEEWEDYEEPKDKGYWYIDDLCRMRYSSELLDEIDDRPNNWMIRKLCGNYFDTREEAEKAVEKLKAWKRLKDEGFRFQFWSSSYSGDSIAFFIDWINADSKKEIEDDLDFLFGGE